MARISRMCYESSFYHVMVQGINRERIYEKSFMKDYFIDTLCKKSQELGVAIIAFCIMDNHVHLLLYTENIKNLMKLMASINTKYAKYYNKINKRVGYVYRDRYRCENIFTEHHLINCIKYIHNNPVNARICKSPKEYKYSSFCEFLYGKEAVINSKIVAPYIDMIICDGSDSKIQFIDVNDDFGNKLNGDIKEVINKYLMKQRRKLCELDNSEIKELSKIILNTCSITKKELVEVLQIERTKWYRIMGGSY